MSLVYMPAKKKIWSQKSVNNATESFYSSIKSLSAVRKADMHAFSAANKCHYIAKEPFLQLPAGLLLHGGQGADLKI